MRTAGTSTHRPVSRRCSIDASVGQKCPECAAPTGRHQVITARSLNGPTPVTQAILIINIAIFVVGFLAGRTELVVRFGQINQLVLDGEGSAEEQVERLEAAINSRMRG